MNKPVSVSTKSPQIPQRERVASVMRESSWTQQCSTSTFNILKDSGDIYRLKRKEVFSRHTTRVGQMGMIITGTLEFSRTSSHAKRCVLSYLGAGQLINIIPYFDGNYTQHDIVSHTESLVVLWRRELIESILTEDAGFTRAIIHILCSRARRSFLAQSYFSLLSVRHRCVMALLHFSEDFGIPHAKGILISLKLSQEQFADVVGCTRPVLNRELKLLEQEGKIEILYSNIVILDEPGLRTMMPN